MDIESLFRPPIVPVVALDRFSDAGKLCDALNAGGITTVEITLRTREGEAAIASVADRTDVLVGAGTVTTADEASRAAAAGARYLVSPGISRSVAERAEHEGLPLVPGIATPSDLQLAREFGITHVKMFPARILGGVGMIDALHAPFPEIRFMPSGGVGPDDAANYLAHPAVFAVGGSWMAPKSALRVGDWETVRRLSAKTVARLR